ncbi:MAG: cupin domain-containing protein [Clostridiales bacterium]|nr:cupin domain-containing protein [Clostridiales bacterium]
MAGNQAPAMLRDVAARIHDLREISGFSLAELARLTDVSETDCARYEAGAAEMPFTFVHKCALAFGVDIVELIEGTSPRLSSYTVTRKGQGEVTTDIKGVEMRNLAPFFRKKIVEPYFTRYSYDPTLQAAPIHTITHSGQEFDYILSGVLRVQVGDHTETLREGDSIYFDSSTPHGMIAAEGQDCLFMAIVIPGEETEAPARHEAIAATAPARQALVCDPYIDTVEDDRGALQSIHYHDIDHFNFAFDIIDRLADTKGDQLAMLHLDVHKAERRFTFADLKAHSNKAANYFRSLGIQKGDRVMLVLRRQYHFWIAMLALEKLGAIVIPATDQLLCKDYIYRFKTAEVNAVLCTCHGSAADEIDAALKECPSVKTKVYCGGSRPGWHDYDSEYSMFSPSFLRTQDAPGGEDPLLMFFTSGTTGYPKLVSHNHKYPLGHFITAKYWHCVLPGQLHLTLSDTGWAKALWGKMFGQWLCEAAIFVYDMDRFHAADIMPLFKQYDIKTFCAPPTMYRMLIKEELSKYDLSSIRHATTAGEALNPEVFLKFKEATGVSIMEGFGQSESTLIIGTLVGMSPKVGSMGRPTPLYDVDIVDPDGKSVPDGETGEIVIRTDNGPACGLLTGYYGSSDRNVMGNWHDGLYHTGDTAWRDEDGYFWYVGRVDDLIKSSGYRIGPFEIESVIMELPYVLECGVSAAPDPVRGQVVKASIVLVKGKEGTEELKKEIQNYVKQRTAPYKYPRIVVFRDELPKTTSGKIQRALL